MMFTQILQQAAEGDAQARADVIRAAYDDLRKIAAGRMASDRQDHTLTSTALVHEVSLKLLEDDRLPTSGRKAFFAYVSTAMRNFLIDYARTRGRQKRGGDRMKFSFDEAMVACSEQSDDLIALDDALKALSEIDPRKAQLVEMRYFGGLSNSEIADALDISLATVKRDWAVAKAWLLDALRNEERTETPDES